MQLFYDRSSYLLYFVVYFTTVQHLNYVASNGRNKVLERISKETVAAYSRYSLGICLDGLRKTTKKTQDNRCLVRYPNRAPPE